MTSPAKQIALTHEEKNSPLWRKLMSHWAGQLDAMRLQNDGALSELETARLRGRIVELKTNLALNNDKPDLQAPPR